MRSSNRLSTTLVSSLALCLGCANQHVVPSDQGELIRSQVAAQASAELAIWPNGESVISDAIRLEPGPKLGDGITCWRAWIPRDHWHPYVVAASGNRILQLGGFASPDLQALAEYIKPQTVDSASVAALAKQLTIAADPSGGVQALFAQQPDSLAESNVGTLWKRATPALWPSDTVVRQSNGTWLVRITLLSRETRSYTQHWTANIFAFEFSHEGRLRGWARRASEPFSG